MLSTFIALAFLAQAPKTFEDFELAKIKAYHGIQTFREELDVDLKMGEQGFTLLRTSALDGPKQHCTMNLSNPGRFEFISDGTTSWAIGYPEKQYSITKLDPTEKFDPKAALTKVEADSFFFNFNAGSPTQFACEPEPTLVSNESVQDGTGTARRVVFKSTSRKGKHANHSPQWFEPDLMDLKKRFED